MTTIVKADSITKVEQGNFKEKDLEIHVDDMDFEDFVIENLQKLLDIIDDDDMIKYLTFNGYKIDEE